MNELSLDVVQSQVGSKHRLLVDQDTVDEINRLAEDPDYGPEFLQSYLDCLSVMADAPKNNHTQYLNAMKFFSLVEAGNTLKDAYIKVFPDRYDARCKSYPNDDETRDKIIRGEASRYNSSKLVSEIKRVATIPVHLVHRHLLNEAIIQTAKMMLEARSEMVRQKAADTLIRELKPNEDAELKVGVSDETKSVIDELRKATQELAAAQKEAVMAGVPMKQIAAARIFQSDDEIIDVEPTAAESGN